MVTALPPTAATSSPPRTLRLAGRDLVVAGPSLHDPRLHVSLVIGTLHVLGQVRLGFAVSVAQILITIGVCALLEAVSLAYREGLLAWPASGILTGSGIAFILRVAGTEHGDWWSLHGIEWFLLACLFGSLSKYLVRPGARHVFNPSNVALVWVLLVIGPTRVFAQPLWWGDDTLGVVLAYAVLVMGGWAVLRRLGLLRMVAAFLATIAVLAAAVAALGGQFVAAWRATPITGVDYWQTVALSPEVLLFALFMITDPRTTPRGASGRTTFGVAVALVFGLLLWFQPTEFGVKVALLGSLVVVSAFAPVFDGHEPGWLRRGREGGWRLRARHPASVAVAVVLVAVLVDTALLAGNQRIVEIERGLTAPGTGQ